MPKGQRIDQVDRIPGVPLQSQDLASAGQVEAMVNAGRWIVRCPDDPKGSHFAEVEFGQDKFICPGCYPDLIAITFEKRPDEFYNPVQDTEKRKKSKADAEDDQRCYDIIFPELAADIIDALRQRPAVAMNWLPGETVEALIEENAAHAVSDTKPGVSIVEGTVE